MPGDGCLNAPAPTADVTVTWSPHTIGEDQPRPGTSTFHATLIVVDHVVGSVAMADTARPDGPRNCGHVVSGGEGTAATTPVTKRITGTARVTPESYMTVRPTADRGHGVPS